MKLTEELIAQASKGAPPSSVTNLALPNKQLQEVSCLKALANLGRLDLSHNRLQSIEALSNCKNLKWLSIASNELRSLSGVELLSSLVVLNCSSNRITSMKEVEGLVELRALIVNDNKIKSICKLHKLTALNTLVLSKNPISSIGTSLENIPSLSKLSLSNCELQDVGSLKHLVDLKELRLAHNKIKHLSKDLSKNSQLRIIDLGSNSLKKISDMEVLSMLPYLKNLNVRGNPFCLQDNYEDKVKTLLPNLQVLDGHPLKSSGKKRPNNDQSVLPSSTKLNKVGELEGLKTSKKPKQGERVDKAVTALEDDGDQQISKDGLHTSKKPKKQRKAEKAVKDEEGSMLDDTLDETDRKDSWGVVSGHDDNDDDKPFINFIGQKEPARQVPTMVSRHGSKKDNSGLVSIVHNQSKVSKQKKSKHNAKTGPMFCVSMTEVEVGAGGFSSWD
eukprot:c16598_g1_i1 orf=627-1964(-)